MPTWLYITLFILACLQHLRKKIQDFEVPFEIQAYDLPVDDLPVRCSTTHCWCYHPISEAVVSRRMAFKPGNFNFLRCKELFMTNPEPMNWTFKRPEIGREHDKLFMHVNIITETLVALKTVTVAPCTPKLLCTLLEPVAPKVNDNRTEIIFQKLTRILFDAAITLLIIFYLLNL
ncbi:hypothetical protein R5R35_009586 [Gryllus longicercus]|uniref:Accessory gland protein n=1 Tax=Gryllus longicercus TaxID=2509291 RepID=A0AAN9UYY0_9ORTH